MPSLPKKYIPKGLRDQDKKIAENELKKSRKLYKQGKYHTRKEVKSFKTKKSKHIIRAEKLCKTKIVPTKKLAKKTKCKLSALQVIDSNYKNIGFIIKFEEFTIYLPIYPSKILNNIDQNLNNFEYLTLNFINIFYYSGKKKDFN